MRTLHVLVAATVLLSGVAAAAPDTSLRATAQQLQDVEGTYGLDNGQHARVFELDNRLYVAIGRMRKEIILVASGRFASRDGSVSMQFSPRNGGNDIALSLRGDLQESTPVRLASANRHGRGGADWASGPPNPAG
jgi:hypothetical protein